MADTEKRWNISLPVVVSVAAAVFSGAMMAPLYSVYDIVSKGFPGDKLMTGCVMYLGALPLCLMALPSPVAKYWSTYQPHRENMKWWMCLGGVVGVIEVCMMSFSSPLLPLSVLGMTWNAGSIASSVLIDHVGFLGTPKVRLNRWTPLALLLFSGGCVMNMVEYDKETQKYAINFHWAATVSFASGCLDTLQYCFNRRAGGALPYSVQFLGINYISGAVFIAILWFVMYFIKAGPGYEKPTGTDWYYYILPGLMTFVLNLADVKCCPKIGVAAFAMISIVVETCTNRTVESFQGKTKFNWFDVGGLLMTLSATLVHGFILHHRSGKEAKKLLESEESVTDHTEAILEESVTDHIEVTLEEPVNDHAAENSEDTVEVKEEITL